MPRRSPDRWRLECIQEFRAAAKERFDDALSLAAAGRRTGAIYLWGYSAEMLIKAAYFSAFGLSEMSPITWAGELYPAINRGRTQFFIPWPRTGQGHNIEAWSELLVSERSFRGFAYSTGFGLEVQRQARRIGQLWSETLRYHRNIAYLHEVTQVRQAAEWFLVYADVL